MRTTHPPKKIANVSAAREKFAVTVQKWLMRLAFTSPVDAQFLIAAGDPEAPAGSITASNAHVMAVRNIVGGWEAVARTSESVELRRSPVEDSLPMPVQPSPPLAGTQATRTSTRYS